MISFEFKSYEHLFELRNLFPGLMTSKAEYTLDFKCQNPISTRNLFYMLRRYIYIPKKKYDIWQDPLYVWEAITFCISNKKTFPAWLLNYLTEAGGNLLKATKTGTDKGNPETVSDAFGFNLGKGRSPFTNYLTTEKYIEVAWRLSKSLKILRMVR